jgi:tRNA (guanine37-N1)-methyltransferase
MKEPTTLKELLKGRLTKKELERLVTSYDMLGDIAIIEIPKELKKKEKLIGNALLSLHKHIKVVAKKSGAHTGEFRIQKYRIIAGAKRKDTEYRESGVLMKLHLEKTYFSPRFGTERLRLAKQVKEGEEILVMFSGIAPFPLVIAKNAKPKMIYAVEINPDAHKYAVENVRLNKMENKIRCFQGDVRMIVPTLRKKFDRIAMPLPKGGEDFLDVAIKLAKKNAVIHFYDFLPEDEFHLAEEKIANACKKLRKKCRILGIFRCGQQSPRIYRICADFKVY